MESVVEILCMIFSFIESGFDPELVFGNVGFPGLLGFLEPSYYLLLPSRPEVMFCFPIGLILYGFPVFSGISRKSVSRGSYQSWDLDLQIGCQPIPPRDPSTRKNF